MFSTLKIALRNLTRFGRRTLLTSTLITLGIVAVLLFVAIAGSFKAMMISQFTDAVLGHAQVHRRGYVASIDTLPLNLNLAPGITRKIDETLQQMPEIEAYSQRVKFGGMFSNFTETTSIRVNGIDPAREAATTPALASRISEGNNDFAGLARGEILIPVLLARGMKVKVDDTIVLVATNREGSVNGKTLKVRGIVQSVSGPSGRDGYIHVADARDLLRMAEPEVSEIAIRLRNPATLDRFQARLDEALAGVTNRENQRVVEVHSWADLSPFASIARMIDLLTLFIKIMLVSIVLVSIMNVMIMAVYERIREIGTISAMGTPPRRILGLFLTEGLLLGVGGTFIGTAIALAAVYALNIWQITFNFGQQRGLVLAPSLHPRDVAIVAGLVVLMALAASLQPAWKASRMDPVKALGHV